MTNFLYTFLYHILYVETGLCPPSQSSVIFSLHLLPISTITLRVRVEIRSSSGAGL